MPLPSCLSLRISLQRFPLFSLIPTPGPATYGGNCRRSQIYSSSAHMDAGRTVTPMGKVLTEIEGLEIEESQSYSCDSTDEKVRVMGGSSFLLAGC